MRDARIARVGEWILALVTTGDRAAATVGDLMEVAATRGVVWFMASVLATALSIAWRDVQAEPGRMARLAVRGFFYGVFRTLGWSVLLFVAILAWALSHGAKPSDIETLTTSSGFTIGTILIGNLLNPFLIGRWIARKAPGQEMAACLAFLIFHLAFYILMSVLAILAGYRGSLGEFLGSLSLTAVEALLYFAFTAWARHRSRTTTIL
jgi:hypothetical protein